MSENYIKYDRERSKPRGIMTVYFKILVKFKTLKPKVQNDTFTDEVRSNFIRLRFCSGK